MPVCTVSKGDNAVPVCGIHRHLWTTLSSGRWGDWIKAVTSAVVKVFGCRPMMTAPRTRGPAFANLQGRKPREVAKLRVRSYGDFGAGGLLPRCVDRLFGKRSMGCRAWSADRDRQNLRR